VERVRSVRDGVNIPAIWVAIAVSLLIHAVALWDWFPELRLQLKEPAERGETRIPLQARMIPPVRAPSESLPAVPRALPRQAPAARPQIPPPPVVVPPARQRSEMALNVPSPRTLPPPALTPPSFTPTPPAFAPTPPASAPAPQVSVPAQGDLASFIEARRRARGETTVPGAPTETEEARRNRIVASNLAAQDAASPGFDPNRGGVFQIQRLGFDRAEFVFYGWNRDIRRNASQLIEVRKGEHADIRIAVVRRMIAIIREQKQDDFTWDSRRLGRVVPLSARLGDTAGLEDFLMQEFFPG